MSWPAPGEEAVVKTILLDGKCKAKKATQCWARDKEAKIEAGVWLRWRDASHSGDGQVGDTAACKHKNQ